jgi:hypothetical protein
VGFTTFAAFVAGLTALSPTGVRTKFDAPPNQPLTTGALPAMYPGLPSGTGELGTLTGGVELATVQCDLIVVIQPIAQRSNDRNYAAALAMMDDLNAALEDAVNSLGLDGWNIRVEEIWHDGVETGYWAVIATVRASG